MEVDHAPAATKEEPCDAPDAPREAASPAGEAPGAPSSEPAPGSADEAPCSTCAERCNPYAEPAVQCGGCEQWCHAACVSAPEAKGLFVCQRNYDFVCKSCAESGAEFFEFKALSWRGMVETALYNLTLAQSGGQPMAPGTKGRGGMHSVRDELVPWILDRFDDTPLGHGRNKSKVNEADLLKLVTHGNVSDVFDVRERSHVALKKPRQTCARVAALSAKAQALVRKPPPADPGEDEAASKAARASGGGAAVGSKRRRPVSITGGARRQERPRERERAPPAQPQPQLHELPERHKMVPFVRCTEMGNVLQDGSQVQLSCAHKASQLKLGRAPDDERYLLATGYKGYRTVCATHACGEGAWYYEVRMESNVGGASPTDGHCRLGWATELSTADAPAGYDEHSYGYRSKHGTAFHESRGKRYGEGFRTGDVIGCLISLPQRSTLPRERPRLTLKNSHYLIVDLDQKVAANKGSSISFYKNGELQGVAFADVPSEWYYPAVSLFMDAHVAVNFGPDFAMPPKKLPPGVAKWQPVSRLPAAQAEEDAAAPQPPASRAPVPLPSASQPAPGPVPMEIDGSLEVADSGGGAALADGNAAAAPHAPALCERQA